MAKEVNPAEVGELIAISNFRKLENRVINDEWNLYNLNDRLQFNLCSQDYDRIKRLEEKIEELERRLNG